MYIFSDKNGIQTNNINKKIKVFYNLPIKRKSFNIANEVLQVEKKLNTPVTKLCLNYILYNDFVSQLGIKVKSLASVDQINIASIDAFYRIQKFIKKYGRPDIVIYETIDRPESYIWNIIKKKELLLECKLSPIGCIGVFPVSGLKRQSPLLNKFIPRKSTKNLNNIRKIFYSKNSCRNTYANYHSQVTAKKKLFHLLLNNVIKLFSKDISFRYVFLYFYNMYKMYKYSCMPSQATKNITYFLNHLPEATTFSECPEFHDPLSIILRLAYNRPSEFQILIKEHPMTMFKRPFGFYERIGKLPGVKLVSSKCLTHNLLQKTSAILCTTGSIGFEAYRYDVPVCVLGRPAFHNAPWVTKITKPEEVFSVKKKKGIKNKTLQYLQSFVNASKKIQASSTLCEAAIGKEFGHFSFNLLKKINNKK